MAGVTGRTGSRRWARDRWRELGSFTGRALGTGLAVVALWPGIALASSWERYASPATALGVYLGSLALIGGLWLRGREGIGPFASAGAGLGIAALNLLLIWQLPAGEGAGAALWLHSWGTAVPLILVLCRPLPEPVAVLALLTVTNVAAVLRGDHSPAGMQEGVLHVGIPIVVATVGLALALALRRSVIRANRSHRAAEALAQREHVRQSVQRERDYRVADWRRRIAPHLDAVAGGRRSVCDPELVRECRALADALRAELAGNARSVLETLLPRTPGIELLIRDFDVGHRLREADRVELVRVVRSVCGADAIGRLSVTLVPEGDGPAPMVVAVVAGDRVPVPVPGPQGTLTREGERWWYDTTLSCVAAPALADDDQPSAR